jgi:hypothetical protein
MAGFSFDEYFDNYTDAKYFAEDRQQYGFQTWIMKVE